MIYYNIIIYGYRPYYAGSGVIAFLHENDPRFTGA